MSAHRQATIAAFSTPPGAAGLAVLRLSGDDAVAIADRVFRTGRLPASAATARTAPAHETGGLAALEGYQARFGYVHAPDNPAAPIDQAVALRFRAPASYTGEDVVELQVHGSPAVRQLLFEAVLAAGAEPADAGAFTRRAVLNGRMDLAQAEAVADLIDAEAELSARAALDQLSGRLSLALEALREQLYMQMAAVNLCIEFPEHEEAEVDHARDLPDLPAVLEDVIARLDGLIAGHHQGRVLREGFHVTLAGAPNAGKSSLLNALVGDTRAIVTDVPGTTRDRIEVRLVIDGLPVRLSDTAGLRDDAGAIEDLGIEQTRRALGEADLVFWLLDAVQPVYPTAADRASLGARAALVPVLTKADLIADEAREARFEAIARDWQQSTGTGEGTLLVSSALRGDGLEAIGRHIRAAYERLGAAPTGEQLLITNARHARALVEARDGLVGLAKQLAASPPPLDVLAQRLAAAAESLATIDGQQVDETLLDTLFSRFCVGK